jgi:hypothetical protein
MWQYGGEKNPVDGNSIPGVGMIDKDKMFKDYPTIIKSGGYNNWKKSTTNASTKPSTSKPVAVPEIVYRVKSNGKWGKELKGPAKFKGSTITDIAMKVSRGSIWYQVHVKGGSWLPKVTGYNVRDKKSGYAGNGKEIDAVRGCYNVSDSDKKAKRAYSFKYKVKAKGNKEFFSPQYDNQTTKGQDGYAGVIGKVINGFCGEIIKK